MKKVELIPLKGVKIDQEAEINLGSHIKEIASIVKGGQYASFFKNK